MEGQMEEGSNLDSDDPYAILRERKQHLTSMWFATQSNRLMNFGYTIDLLQLYILERFVSDLESGAFNWSSDGKVIN